MAVNGMALPEEIPVLTEMLSDVGYATHGVGKQHLQPLLAPADRNMPDSRAFWQKPGAADWRGPYYGYQTLDLLLGESDTAHLAGHYADWLNSNHPGAAKWLMAESADTPPPADLDEIWVSKLPAELHYNSWITDCAVRFLNQSRPRSTPFFLFVSYPDPHHPFDPVQPYAGKYNPHDMPLPRVEGDELSRMPPYYGQLYPQGQGFRELYWAAHDDMEAGSMITTGDISDHSMRKAIACTHAMVEMIDDGVGEILSALENTGRSDNTCIVFTSDHGELLGDHGLLHKGPPPYRQLTEVSLIMSGPGIRSGKTTDALTSHIDLAPTLLDIAGVQFDGNQFDGRSLTPLLSDSSCRIRTHNFGEYHPTAKPELYNQTVSTDKWRFTIYPRCSQWGELFNLEDDPGEYFNLFDEPGYEGIKSELSAILATRFPAQPEVNNEVLCKW